MRLLRGNTGTHKTRTSAAQPNTAKQADKTHAHTNQQASERIPVAFTPSPVQFAFVVSPHESYSLHAYDMEITDGSCLALSSSTQNSYIHGPFVFQIHEVPPTPSAEMY